MARHYVLDTADLASKLRVMTLARQSSSPWCRCRHAHAGRDGTELTKKVLEARATFGRSFAVTLFLFNAYGNLLECTWASGTQLSWRDHEAIVTLKRNIISHGSEITGQC